VQTSSEALSAVRSAMRDPLRWSSVIQLLKTVVAAVIAWVLASQTFELPQPFLAPWAALLVVHATVYRTFSRGLKQVTAAVLGVLLAWAVGNVWGLSTVAVAVLLAAGLLVGAVRWFRDESSAIAATGLIVLTTGFSTQDQVLVDRLYDTAIGIGVGLAVNLLVWPPLRDLSAARAIEAIGGRVGALLSDMAAELRASCDEEQVAEWVDRTRDLDDEIDQAWALLRQAKESGRLNPRRAARTVKTTDVFEGVLRDNEQAVAETRSMARTLGYSIDSLVEWEPAFRDRWLDLLDKAGAAITEPDAERVSQVRGELRALAEELGNRELSGLHWPEYGALIMNLRNVVTSMDQVAEHHRLALPRYVRRERLARRMRRR
jgi:Fusaric acid resistance protein family